MISIRSVLAGALVAALVAVPTAAHAQRLAPAAFAPVAFTPSMAALAPSAPAAPADSAPALDRTIANDVAASATADREAVARATPPSDHANVGPNVGLMILGGAGVITGAIVGGSGGTAIAVGGAVVGLYGLYKYLH